MKKTAGFVLAVLCLGLACRTAQVKAPPIDPALQAERQHDVEEILETIAGRENEPAEQVFKNIKVMHGIPAARLLRIMNVGYSQALGVECSHCHVEDYWDVDEKRPKRAAREMILMTRAINAQFISKMENLEGDEPVVNCGTCHRGEVRPGAGVTR